MADELSPPGPGPRDVADQQRGGDPVVNGHPDEPASGTATGRRPALNFPDASRKSHPAGAWPDRRSSSMSRIRWSWGASTVTGSPSRQGGTTDPGTGEGAVSCAVLVTASRLGGGHGQGFDQFLPRDHPPIQLDLCGLQHLGQTRDFLPQTLHPHAGRRLPLLQHSQHRRHRAPPPRAAEGLPVEPGRKDCA
ncbi:hypothetical protein [Streptomyces mirabilis]|uniref:hypothetical protein n=1 Tax=Streptomyces mirabilis TaxID=68239 RepID=UPI0036CCE3D1